MTDYPSIAEYDPYTAGTLFEDAAWRKSFASEPNGGNCVEVNLGRKGLVGVRDTKLAASPVFVFHADEWAAFLAAVKAGRFGLSGRVDPEPREARHRRAAKVISGTPGV